MIDNRIIKLAKNLVNYSVQAKKGDKVLIEASGIEPALITELVKEVYAVGAFPFVEIYDSKIQRAILNGMTKEHADSMAKYAGSRMEEMQCYIGIRGGKNSFETSDVEHSKLEIYSKYYGHPVHQNRRVAKTRWVVLRYPNESMAQLAGMSTEKFTNYYFDVCNLDYSKMDKAMDEAKVFLKKVDKVRILAPDKQTDLTFSIKDIGVKKCSGRMNIPDGEIFSAPVKNSINGTIKFNAPSIHNGTKFEDIFLTFKDGKVVKSSANFSEKLEKVLDTDAGSRFVGEFALGVNPFITEPMGDILFDEKISGSIHMALGNCYDEAPNGNESAVHWDLVHIQTPEFGGGEIYFDDKLVRKDGIFVAKELLCLNPENLK
ncbi:MAG: aminopeptidase [Firmicutes bacterium]|nr:aminopeptidase [Bacillota bacterium]